MSTITFDGQEVPFDELNSYSPQSKSESIIRQFIIKWLSGKDSFILHTSGSTGKPKPISINRSQLEASAKATIKALSLQRNGTVLLCINPEFIGGRMIIVRAMMNDMKILYHETSGMPIEHLKKQVSLCSMVPLQLQNILNDKKHREKLNLIENLLIGGASLDQSYIPALQNFKTKIYATYGMTETVSHIGLKRLNGSHKDDCFQLIEGTNIRQDERGCLVVKGAVTDDKEIVTNDIVKLLGDRQFQWLGRADLVINSGGIKIHPEALEYKIHTILPKHCINKKIAIGSVPDSKLGHRVVIYIESENEIEEIKEILKSELDKYEIPKEFIYKNQFPLTSSGKLDRQRLNS